MQEHRFDLLVLGVEGMDPELALREGHGLCAVAVGFSPDVFHEPGLHCVLLPGLAFRPRDGQFAGALAGKLSALLLRGWDRVAARVDRRDLNLALLDGSLHDLRHIRVFGDIGDIERLDALPFRIGREQHEVARADQTGQHCQHQQHRDAAPKAIFHVAHHLSSWNQNCTPRLSADRPETFDPPAPHPAVSAHPLRRGWDGRPVGADFFCRKCWVTNK